MTEAVNLNGISAASTAIIFVTQIIMEALAQTGAYAILRDEKYAGKLALFGGIDKAKFRGMVKPGDDLVLNAKLIRASSLGGKAEVFAEVNGKTVCSGEIMFAFYRGEA